MPYQHDKINTSHTLYRPPSSAYFDACGVLNRQVSDIVISSACSEPWGKNGLVISCDFPENKLRKEISETLERGHDADLAVRASRLDNL
ncbi:uncharacterized protein CIMG_12818 [Coccidioides immitis RS]|uniref:Uncharacterized protein n=1 Tax=Coccidioides immitis (strain RS) TaxID=246410 RepID=A0A0D8JVE4_COCIM|nr:uncharacterized protein CIMG_12818 [Coccidioides immitis RS]KJF60243.1 hypothetical protein CIMG_12818 [Coccidioides immitis RS]